ncbi:GumC family protein [Qipengyuania sp. DGS5-3]|uniref:GumC family protein n=2 Tax=Erythrobacteraceae TaxID=335929 RepID=UPI0036D3A4CA
MNEFVSTENEGGGSFGAFFAQFPSIMWQRRWWLIIPAVLGIVGGLAAAFLLPTKYQSSAILLVQAPSLPADVIGSQPTEATEQRIEAIRQQIINRPALIGLIENNDLYASERESEPLSELIEGMRDSITLEPQSIEIGPGRQGQTISVLLSFEYTEPAGAQAVAQQLMERIVEVDATTNTAQLNETVQFLSDQQSDLQNQIASQEAEISAFNQRYGGVLAAGGAPIIGGAGATYDFQIATLEREIADLEAQRQSLGSADNRDPAVVGAEASLAAARARYTEGHPDVILAKQRLEQARSFARQNIERLPVENIQRQITFNRNQIAQLRSAKARDQAQVSAVLSERA